MNRLDDAFDTLARRGEPRGPASVLAEARRRAGDGDDLAARRADRDRRGPLAAAAAVAAAVVGGVLLVGALDDDGEVTDVRADQPVTSAPVDGGETATTVPDLEAEAEDEAGTDEPVAATPAAPVPARWIGHDDQHRLVVVDTASGEVVRVLATFDDPVGYEERTGQPYAAGSFLGEIALSPDGSTAYWEVCCEPAPGVTMSVPLDGGEPEMVALGADPALSPDGTRLALVELQWLTVIDLATGDARRIEASGPGTMPLGLANPAWSPDGTQLAFERYDDHPEDGDLVVLDLGTATSLDDARVLASADASGSPTLPTFDREGRLHVVHQPRLEAVEGDGDVAEVRARVFDAGTGAVVSERLLDRAVRGQDHDPTGTWLLRTFSDGTVEHRDAEGAPVPHGDGFRAGAW